MGHRANLIVRRGGATRVHCDQWAGQYLDLELFWGPEPALAWLEQGTPVGVGDLVGEPWCEGALWMDVDAQRLLWYGGDTARGRAHRQVFLEMMGANWPGWTIEWAAHGLLEVLRAADVDVDLRDPMRHRDQRLWSRGRFGWAGHMVAVLRNGTSTVRRVSLSPWVLEAGVAAFRSVYTERKVLGISLAQSVRFEDGSRARWEKDEDEDDVGSPWGGVVVDHDTRTIRHWHAGPTSVDPAAIKAAWPGWTVHHDRDDPAPFLEASQGAFMLPNTPPAQVRAELLEVLGFRLERGTIPNPNRALAAHLATEEGQVISVATQHHRGELVEGERKQAMLRALREQTDP